MYFSAIALISQGVPPLGGVKQRWDGKNQSSIHTRLSRPYLALASLSCYKTVNYTISFRQHGWYTIMPSRTHFSYKLTAQCRKMHRTAFTVHYASTSPQQISRDTSCGGAMVLGGTVLVTFQSRSGCGYTQRLCAESYIYQFHKAVSSDIPLPFIADLWMIWSQRVLQHWESIRPSKAHTTDTHYTYMLHTAIPTKVTAVIMNRRTVVFT